MGAGVLSCCGVPLLLPVNWSTHTHTAGTRHAVEVASRQECWPWQPGQWRSVASHSAVARPGVGEDATLEPTNPYSAAKAGAEMIAKAYLTSYRLPVITTRGNNVYGPHQFPEKSVPKFILLALRAERLPIHGSGARSCIVLATLTRVS